MGRGVVASSGGSRLGAAAHRASGGTIKCLYTILGEKSPGSSCCGKGSGGYAGHKADYSTAWGNQQCFLWDWKEQGWGQSQHRAVLRDGHGERLGESTEGAQSVQKRQIGLGAHWVLGWWHEVFVHGECKEKGQCVVGWKINFWWAGCLQNYRFWEANA